MSEQDSHELLETVLEEVKGLKSRDTKSTRVSNWVKWVISLVIPLFIASVGVAVSWANTQSSVTHLKNDVAKNERSISEKTGTLTINLKESDNEIIELKIGNAKQQQVLKNIDDQLGIIQEGLTEVQRTVTKIEQRRNR